MAPQPQNVTLDIEAHIAVVTIDHPPANTWNLATLEAFEAIVERLATDPEVRVVILVGAGDRFFSAGFDVKDAANGPVISPRARDLWRRLDRFAKPLIAAVNGFALGGGLELALTCHFRLLVDDPRIHLGLTELNLGIIPGWGGTQRLPRLVGDARARDMILLSRRLSPAEALASGLVDRLVPRANLIDEALALAAELAQRPPLAVRWVLQAMAAGRYEGLEAGLQVEAEGSRRVRASEDCREGFLAFLEKRTPHFTGR